MAKLDSLITNDLTGEAMNYDYWYDPANVDFKHVFNVVKNDDFTWTITCSLYMKLSDTIVEPGVGAYSYNDLWLGIGNEYFDLGQEVSISNTDIKVNNVVFSNTPLQYCKVFECTRTIECSSSGRLGIRLNCGKWTYEHTTRYLFSDYTYIYLTLPAFSGLQYKINGSYKKTMPWIKVNGEWKRALQYVKVNGEWKEYEDTWLYNPEA